MKPIHAPFAPRPQAGFSIVELMVAVTLSLFVLAGMAASAVLAGRKLRQHRIPNRSVAAGIVLGIAGMFVIPVVGLFVGFAAGLLLSELHRTRDVRTALTTSWAALKATGLGMLAEFGLACLAASTWVIGVWVAAASG